MSQRNEQLAEVFTSAEHSSWCRVFATKFPNRIGDELRTAIIRHGEQERYAKGAFRAIDRQLQLSIASTEKRDDHALADGKGTRLIRSWRGTRHEVSVLKKGFAYRGKVYRSLSEIARLITGTRWSGPRFFGLKEST